MDEDSDLWDVICNGPFVFMKTIVKPTVTVPKIRKKFNDADLKAIEKNFRTKQIFVCGIGLDEYNRISTCQSAKEIWEALQKTHKGKTQVKSRRSTCSPLNYPLLKQDQYKHNTNKVVKRNPDPDKRFKRKEVSDNVVKQALAAWGHSSSKSGEDN
nr:uncharacterized protein LOC117274990 [Nicotiana tomentosiformis]